MSRDLDDVVALVDGRVELIDEVRAAPPSVREYVSAELLALLREQAFLQAIPGFLRPDAASQARAETVVLPRLRGIAAS